eukprot:5524469-Amphidinium_carterae.2
MCWSVIGLDIDREVDSALDSSHSGLRAGELEQALALDDTAFTRSQRHPQLLACKWRNQADNENIPTFLEQAVDTALSCPCCTSSCTIEAASLLSSLSMNKRISVKSILFGGLEPRSNGSIAESSLQLNEKCHVVVMQLRQQRLPPYIFLNVRCIVSVISVSQLFQGSLLPLLAALPNTSRGIFQATPPRFRTQSRAVESSV